MFDVCRNHVIGGVRHYRFCLHPEALGCCTGRGKECYPGCQEACMSQTVLPERPGQPADCPPLIYPRSIFLDRPGKHC